jgi:capsid portal protein
MANENTDPIVLEEGHPLSKAIQEAALEVGETDETVIEEIFITDNGEGGDKLMSELEIIKSVLASSMSGFDSTKIHREVNNAAMFDMTKTADVSKSIVDGSTQSDSELGWNDLSMYQVVEPPYPPQLMSAFLEVDSTHFRCVRTKVTDAVGKEYMIEPVTLPDGTPYKPFEGEITKQVEAEITEVKNFIDDCNEIIGFDGVLERVGMDYEAIGWGAIEVIRGRDMKVKKLAHLPASRIRVLRGWGGFVESLVNGKFIYYQNFGDKVVSTTETDPFTDRPVAYDPKRDGTLNGSSAKWSLIDRHSGKPTADFSNSANEVIWIPRHHCSTIYYGLTDVLPALGDLLANVHIRDYLLQFFEHNTIPRYAIIIKGAKIADGVKKEILKFFSDHIKGKAHKTLIIPIPAVRGEVEIKFEKLAADVTEGSFQDTRKNNSQGILTAHGVSPAIIGINDAASLGSGKGMSQAEIYKDRIVTPSQRRFARPLNRLFRIGLGIKIVALKFSPLDIRDLEAEMQIYTGYLDKGCMTINGVIKKVGLGDPIEGGDRAFIVLPHIGIQFVDEMTTQVSQQMQDLQDQVDSAKQELQNRALQQKAQQAAQNGQKPQQSAKSSKSANSGAGK